MEVVTFKSPSLPLILQLQSTGPKRASPTDRKAMSSDINPNIHHIPSF